MRTTSFFFVLGASLLASACTPVASTGDDNGQTEGALRSTSFARAGKPCVFGPANGNPLVCGLVTSYTSKSQASGTLAQVDLGSAYDVTLVDGNATGFLLFGDIGGGQALSDISSCLQGFPTHVSSNGPGTPFFVDGRSHDASECGMAGFRTLYFAVATAQRTGRVTGTANGTNIPVPGGDGQACSSTQPCADPLACVKGVCAFKTACGPDTCGGCCLDAYTCVGGDLSSACGRGGVSCAECNVDGDNPETCEGGQCTDSGVGGG